MRCYRCINKTDLSFLATAFPRRAVKVLTELPPRRIFKFDTFTKSNVNITILNKERGGGGETRLKLATEADSSNGDLGNQTP